MEVETHSFPPGIILPTLQMYQQQQAATGCLMPLTQAPIKAPGTNTTREALTPPEAQDLKQT